METLILALATYAITAALTTSDGPFGAFYKLRNTKGFGVLDCFLCTSVIVAALLALTADVDFGDWLLLSFALAGAATFLHNLTELDL